MKSLSKTLLQLAFDTNGNEPLTKEQIAICEEWASGKGSEIMKISSDDPRLLEYAGLYDKLEEKKGSVWQQLQCNMPNA